MTPRLLPLVAFLLACGVPSPRYAAPRVLSSPYADAGLPYASCPALEEAILLEVGHSRTCQADADCHRVETACGFVAGCAVYVDDGGVGNTASLAQQWNQECGPLVGTCGCPADPGAVCDAGACVNTSVPPYF